MALTAMEVKKAKATDKLLANDTAPGTVKKEAKRAIQAATTMRDYQLYLALNEIEHTKTKVRHPQTQTNGICERLLQRLVVHVSIRPAAYSTRTD